MWNKDSVFLVLIVVSNNGLIPKTSTNNLKKFCLAVVSRAIIPTVTV